MAADDLEQYLDALDRESCYRVDATLKESAHEVTQRVFFVGENGTQLGPYIRKFISRDAGMGVAYERIFESQRAGKRFKHIPTIIECYRRDDNLVVVMELVTGETLQDAVYRNDPSLKLARAVFPKLCDAVTELHEGFEPPIIHRDLKPSNVIVSGDDLVIIDYGIAREYHEGALADTVHFGTRAFAPPEQFGFGQTTVRSDVYALGMLLYFCLTETIPDSAVREAGFVDDRVSPALRGVIVHATALDPGERYASAAELKRAFLDAGGLPEGTRPPTTAPGSSPSRFSVPTGFGKVYNVVLVVITAIMCIASFYDIFVPPENMRAYPSWYITMGYAFVVPVVMVGLCFALLDKRRLGQRFPLFYRLRGWRGWVAFVVLVVIVMTMVGIASHFAGLT